ncbi:unnamed protein product [Spirodela intermedia]|uniref:Uncharacterized protein n=1 Tax=Spirodela intermedia TaxID=51605 RepID=A0A7I8KCQ9_SPIIN|nr:unnamed protein product [Spirodela intermedia]
MASVKFFAVVAAALLLSSSLLVSAQLPGNPPFSAAVRAVGDPGDEDCVFAGPCRTRLDCARPCKALGHSPTAKSRLSDTVSSLSLSLSTSRARERASERERERERERDGSHSQGKWRPKTEGTNPWATEDNGSITR